MVLNALKFPLLSTPIAVQPPPRATQVSHTCHLRVTCPAGSQRHGKGPGSGSPAGSPTLLSHWYPMSQGMLRDQGDTAHRPPSTGP